MPQNISEHHFSEWLTKTEQQVLQDLKSRKEGLSPTEVERRLQYFGQNEIKEREYGWREILIRQFKSPFVYLLLIASTISLLLGEYHNSFIISIFVFINLFLSVFQEAKAQRAVLLLKKYLPLRTIVLREGKGEIVDKKNLVPGDIVLLESGNIVSADLRILQATNLFIDESVLTGESVQITKIDQPLPKAAREIFQAQNIAFAGTAVMSGKAIGIVINTGTKTALGEITKLVSSIQRESGYEKNLLQFSRLILRVVLITIVVIFLANLIIKGKTNLFDFSIFCIALIVGIIPEALPTVVTFSLSQGALRLSKEKVVVKRLSAIEDFGNIEVLCTDKTGTITENRLTLEDIFSFDKEKCLLLGMLSSSLIKKEGLKGISGSFDPARTFSGFPRA